MTLVPHVDPAGIGMDDSQARIIASQTPPQISPLLTVHWTAA